MCVCVKTEEREKRERDCKRQGGTETEKEKIVQIN